MNKTLLAISYLNRDFVSPCNHMIDLSNRLPEYVVTAPSIDSFKNRLTGSFSIVAIGIATCKYI